MSAPRTVEVPVLELETGGLRVLVKHNPAHEVVAARLYTRGGAANLTAETAGAEAMYARLARRGTQRYPKELLNGLVSRLGIDVGATVSHDATVFTLRCLRRFLDEAWDAFADVVADPRLEPADLEIVRQQMLLERSQALDSPDGALGELARERIYAGHPYAANPHGTEVSLPTLDAALLRSHAARCFTRANALLVIVGDVTRDDTERLAARFAALPAGSGAAPLPPPLHFSTGSVHIEARDLPTNYVLGEFTAPALRDADHPAMQLALSVLRDRFFEEVRTKRNLSYAPSASLGHDVCNLGSIYVTAVDVPTTLGVMREEMRRLAREPIPRKELADKVRTFVTRYYLQNETNQAQVGFLAAYDLWGGGWRRASEFVTRLEAVAPEDVARVTSAAFHNIQYVALGDPATIPVDALVDP
jgi:zinc protease